MSWSDSEAAEAAERAEQERLLASFSEPARAKLEELIGRLGQNREAWALLLVGSSMLRLERDRPEAPDLVKELLAFFRNSVICSLMEFLLEHSKDHSKEELLAFFLQTFMDLAPRLKQDAGRIKLLLEANCENVGS